MPYSRISDLPDHVRKYPEKIQREWMHIWMSVWQETKDEEKAFKAANAILKKKKEAIDEMSELSFKESLPGRLVEADPEGKVWEVVVIEEGESKNGRHDGNGGFIPRYYSREAIEAVAKHLEGAKAFTYTAKDRQEHLPLEAKREQPYGLVGNLVGWFSEPRVITKVVEGTEKAVAVAKFHIDEGASWLRQKLLDAWKRGNHDYLGLSIDAVGVSEAREHLGKMVDWVGSITGLDSVDVVTHPAAGGKFERLVASMDKYREDMKMDKIKKILLQLIEAVKPDVLEDFDKDAATAEAIAEKFVAVVESLSDDKFSESVLKSKLNRAYGYLQEDKLEEAESIFSDILNPVEPPKVEDDPEPVETASTSTESNNTLDRHMGITEQKANQILKELELTQTRVALKEELQDANLPDIARERVKHLYRDRVATRAQIRESISQEKEYLSKLSGSGVVKVPGQTIEVREEEQDKKRKAFEGFFENKDIDGIPRFRSFTESCKKVMGDGFASPAEILREIALYSPDREEQNYLRESLQTSDLASVLGTAINNVLIREYSESPLQAWREVASDITSISSFQTQTRSIFGGYGDLSTVAEQGTYNTLTSPGDDANTYSISKYGGIDDITMEMVANDNVGFIRRIPRSLARAAIRTLYKAVFDVFVDNTATAYDGTTLFHGSHSNSGTSSLSLSAIDAAEYAMRTQTAYGNSAETLGAVNKPVLLCVPNELKSLAMLISESDTNFDATAFTTVASQTATTPNPYKGLKYMVIDYWTDAKDYILVADKMEMPLLEVGFFNGREEPELFVQDSNMIAATSVFNADKISYKIRHIFGICVLDYRGFYKGVV